MMGENLGTYLDELVVVEGSVRVDKRVGTARQRGKWS